MLLSLSLKDELHVEKCNSEALELAALGLMMLWYRGRDLYTRPAADNTHVRDDTSCIVYCISR